MEFCDICGSYIDKLVETGKIILRCSACGKERSGTNKDTLFYQAKIESSADISVYNTFLDISPYGPNSKVIKKCDKCGLNYQTKSILGDNCVVIYTCKCQNEYNFDPYNPIQIETSQTLKKKSQDIDETDTMDDTDEE